MKRLILLLVLALVMTALIACSSATTTQPAPEDMPDVPLGMPAGPGSSVKGDPSVKLSECIELIRRGKADELSLTIYYLSPDILTRVPVSQNALIEKYFEYKITASGSCLREHIDLLDQVANAALAPVEQESYVNARIYYVFTTKNNGKVFDVCISCHKGSIFVNGLEVKANDLFYDVVTPFLPENAAKAFETYLKRDSHS